ncbi:hypothetical protein D9758_003731 [Tetrapyrgos nigripes]|uniref:Uncharacterized protein n=1 Tax=Tetrapyrgos nigripes TaxID=182062 RepID=A0A8H5LRI9_9AGAR|nr:hypothetical protein D9758_003731 [Tetrapyrgos nigripes]
MDYHSRNACNPQDPHVSSDIDSFSDSDWLDISRESDNESLSSRDSEHIEAASSSLSRRSSFSTGSSRDGEVEAWEGFVEDSADEATPHTRALAPEHRLDIGLISEPDANGNTAEEEKLVRDGLDQSVIGTLSASRSSSYPSTVQNSLRDLRLSFPDPLTSSRDELNRSYDTVLPTEADISISSEETESSVPDAMSDSLSTQDPSLFPTPEVLAQDVQSSWPSETIEHLSSDFEVVLYGRSSHVKWTFVRDLIRKAGLGDGHFSSSVVESVLDREYGAIQLIDNIPVTDRTYGASPVPRSGASPSRPSLAVIFLPSLPPLLDEHTRYLPVITPCSDDSQSSDNIVEEAKAAWSTFSIPASRVLYLQGRSTCSLFAAKDVDKLDPVLARRSLQQLHTPMRSWTGLFEQFNTAHAVTIFALFLLVGFSLNTTLGVQSSKPSTVIALMSPSRVTLGPSIPLNSSAILLRTTSSLSTVPVPLKNSLAIFSRGPTPLSTSPSSFAAAAPSTSKDIQTVSAESMLVIKAMKDLIIRPTTEVENVVTKATPPPVPATTPKSEEESSSSLSLRLVDSLSVIVETTVKALIEVASSEYNELLVVIDEFVRAIDRQRRLIVEQSKSTVQIIREHVGYRHNRAKGRAREIKERTTWAGRQVILYASGGAEVARKRAHTLKDKVTFSTAWSSYTKAHGEWSHRLHNGRPGGGTLGAKLET